LPGVKETKDVPLEDIFYGCWRCVVIHEGHWPAQAPLTPTSTDGTQIIDLSSGSSVGLPEDWVLGIADAVENSIEMVFHNILRFPMYILCVGPRPPSGEKEFKLQPGNGYATVTVRNQLAVPIFTDENRMKPILEHHPEFFVGVLPKLDYLRKTVEWLKDSDRFVFNPKFGEILPLSHTRGALLSTIRRYLN
jgi:hypothetical protein